MTQHYIELFFKVNRGNDGHHDLEPCFLPLPDKQDPNKPSDHFDSIKLMLNPLKLPNNTGWATHDISKEMYRKTSKGRLNHSSFSSQ